MDIEIILEKLEDAICGVDEIRFISPDRVEHFEGRIEGLQQAINIIKLNEKKEETK